MTDSATVEQMKERAQAVQAVVQDVSSLEDAMAYTVQLTRHKQGKTLAAAKDEALPHLMDLFSRVTRKEQEPEDIDRLVKVARHTLRPAFLKHAPCHLCRGLGVEAAPRQLIERAGFSYVPARDEDVCCGFGGSYSVEFPEISAEMLKKKLDHVAAAGAEILVTDCPGCVLRLKGGMENAEGTWRSNTSWSFAPNS